MDKRKNFRSIIPKEEKLSKEDTIMSSIIQNISKNVISPETDLFYKDPEKWYNELRKYILTIILPLFLPSESKNNDTFKLVLVDEKAMPIWRICFTHESYNPNIGQNYQLLEYLGDEIMDANLASYLQGIDLKLSESEMTLLSNRFLSETTQSRWGSMLGYDKWVRTVMPKTKKLNEDLFEAVFGAIFTIAEHFLGIGTGYILCQNAIVQLFDSIDLREEAKKDNVTIVKEIFEKMWHSDMQFNPSQIQRENNPSPGLWIYTIKFTEEAKEDLKKRKNNIIPDILSEAKGETKDEAKEKAYTKAVINLKKNYGITYELAISEKKNRDKEKYGNEAYKKALREGYKDLKFTKPYPGDNLTYIQLIGIKKDGTEDILITLAGKIKRRGPSTGFNDTPGIKLVELKMKAMEEYVSSGKSTTPFPREVFFD